MADYFLTAERLKKYSKTLRVVREVIQTTNGGASTVSWLTSTVNKFETLTRWWVSTREIFEHLDRIKDLVEHLITEGLTTVQLPS